jgi:hypothetical protein
VAIEIAGGRLIDLDDLDGIAAFERQVLLQGGEVKELVHQASQVGLGERREVERLEPCVKLRRSNLRDDPLAPLWP